MKNIVRNLTILSCVGSSAFAAPFLAIGDNAELFATGEASVAYNDNILLASGVPGSPELEDTIFTFVPGFDLQFGKDSLIKGNLIGTATLTSYADNDNLNNQLLAIGGNSTYDNGSLKLGANASFKELDQPTVDVVPNGKLVERHVADVGVNGELAFSEKISAGAGIAYSHVDYKDPAYTEEESYTVPVNIYYELTPKVDVSAGIRYTNTELDNGAEYDAYYYNVGARGSFTPKLSGSFSVGYNTRSVNIGPDDDDSIGADASLAYAYSDKTQFTLAASRNFSNATAGGASYENSEITIGASSAITVDWRLNAALTYRMLDYQNVSRTDDYVQASVGATYLINTHLSTSLTYIFRDNSSDAGAANEFSNNVVSLSISARY
ncbi:outer membrane beta-barrel protein [Rariglobus hedericola]|uniref:Outer membrane beta-barrel protein n=1 Tax=Rariglobus hedericola TaxID=2597822 RepID=A0A556QJN7_9BACT|nr:outer membrane beta-barrel protein [Rariglobus hedericola]TSJ76864.1 outer membrane beta-barrel protein [Rariglobus hedericola]